MNLPSVENLRRPVLRSSTRRPESSSAQKFLLVGRTTPPLDKLPCVRCVQAGSQAPPEESDAALPFWST